jgi:hypothetical protein
MNRNVTYLALVLLVAAGCGGAANKYDAVVTGTVTVDGELAKSGIVTFHPVDEGNVAIGRIHPDGSYSLRTGQGDLQQVDGGTVEPGEYIVTVSVTAPPTAGARVGEGGPPIPGPSLVAAKYSSKDSSDLRRTVKAGPQVMILELEAAEIVPPADEADASAAEAEGAETGEVPAAVDASSEATPATQGQPPTSSPAAAGNAAENSAENAQP